jgi:hypothetical protein
MTLPPRHIGRVVNKQLEGTATPAPERKAAAQRERDDDDEKTVRRMTEMARRGHIHKAVQIGMGGNVRIAPGECDDVVEALTALHPKRHTTDKLRHVAVEVDEIIVTDQEVLTQARKMAKGDAPGASGLASDVLKQLLEYEEQISTEGRLLGCITELVSRILKNTLDADAADAIRRIRLIPLAKRRADGSFKGVRPVAMSETILKLAANVALARIPGVGSKFDHQYGMRKGGVEEAIFKVQDAVRAGRRVRTLDASNAYNTVHRHAFMDAIRTADYGETFSPMKGYVNFAYGQRSKAVYEDANDKLHEINVDTGVRQGDPMAPLLFCLAIQPLLDEFAKRHPSFEIVAFLDDIAIIGSKETQEDFDEVVDEFKKLVKKIGLVLRDEHDTEESGKEPFRYLGAAITAKASQVSEALKVFRPLDQPIKFGEKLARVDDVSLGMTLLRQCGVSKGMFVARVHGSEALDYLKTFDDEVTKATLSKLLHAGTGWIGKAQQLMRPVRYGGYGMTMMSSIADIANKAARARQPQWEVESKRYTAEELEQFARDKKGVIPEAGHTASEKPLTSEESRAIIRYTTGIPLNTVQDKNAAGEMFCRGCQKAYPPEEYIDHSVGCSRKAGKGNTTIRHNAMRDAAIEQCKKGGLATEKELLVESTTPDGVVKEQGRIDMVVGQIAYDFTVTKNAESRTSHKKKLYDGMLPPSLSLKVIAVTPKGRIHSGSLFVAHRLAKSASMSFNEFWTPVLAEVKRHTARALMKARDEVSEAAMYHRTHTQPTAPHVLPEESMDSLAKEGASESDGEDIEDVEEQDAPVDTTSSASTAQAAAPAAAATVPAPQTPVASSDTSAQTAAPAAATTAGPASAGPSAPAPASASKAAPAPAPQTPVAQPGSIAQNGASLSTELHAAATTDTSSPKVAET